MTHVTSTTTPTHQADELREHFHHLLLLQRSQRIAKAFKMGFTLGLALSIPICAYYLYSAADIQRSSCTHHLATAESSLKDIYLAQQRFHEKHDRWAINLDELVSALDFPPFLTFNRDERVFFRPSHNEPLATRAAFERQQLRTRTRRRIRHPSPFRMLVGPTTNGFEAIAYFDPNTEQAPTSRPGRWLRRFDFNSARGSALRIAKDGNVRVLNYGQCVHARPDFI